MTGTPQPCRWPGSFSKVCRCVTPLPVSRNFLEGLPVRHSLAHARNPFESWSERHSLAGQGVRWCGIPAQVLKTRHQKGVRGEGVSKT